jgi:hypothetical protein
VLYVHTFTVTPPSSTTSTTQQFITYYSAPSLTVTPREGVDFAVTVSRGSQGGVAVSVAIANKSASAFFFSREDLQLYLNRVRIEPTQEGADAPTEVAAAATGSTNIYFTPVQFDPYAAGLLYTSSDPQSKGFTASDGPDLGPTQGPVNTEKRAGRGALSALPDTSKVVEKHQESAAHERGEIQIPSWRVML